MLVAQIILVKITYRYVKHLLKIYLKIFHYLIIVLITKKLQKIIQILML